MSPDTSGPSFPLDRLAPLSALRAAAATLGLGVGRYNAGAGSRYVVGVDATGRGLVDYHAVSGSRLLCKAEVSAYLNGVHAGRERYVAPYHVRATLADALTAVDDAREAFAETGGHAEGGEALAAVKAQIRAALDRLAAAQEGGAL